MSRPSSPCSTTEGDWDQSGVGAIRRRVVPPANIGGHTGEDLNSEEMDADEFFTDGTQQCNFTDLLVNGIEASQTAAPITDPVNTAPAARVKSSQGRGKTFSVPEDKLLVSAWLNVSLDPIQGADQSHGTYWARITEYFHGNQQGFESTRSESSLVNRWSAIQHDVNLFCGCLSRIEARPKSGSRDTDKMADACALFKAEDKKHRTFKEMHCWNILKDKAKWKDKRKEIAGAKKASNNKRKAVPNSCPASGEPAAPADAVSDAQPSGRPEGKKKEKQKLRHGKTIEALDYLMEKKKEADIERELKKEERCQKAFALQEERIKLEREKFEYQKKEAEKAEKEAQKEAEKAEKEAQKEAEKAEQNEEERILALDLSKLSSAQQQYYDWKQKQILAKRCNI